MSKKNKTTLKSNCCNAPIRTEGDKDFKNSFEGTFYYVCSKCKQPCDVHLDERKIWLINPKTKVVPNKKKDRKFTDKELKKFKEEEDF